MTMYIRKCDLMMMINDDDVFVLFVEDFKDFRRIVKCYLNL